MVQVMQTMETLARAISQGAHRSRLRASKHRNIKGFRNILTIKSIRALQRLRRMNMTLIKKTAAGL